MPSYSFITLTGVLMTWVTICSCSEPKLRPLVMIHGITVGPSDFDIITERVHHDFPDMTVIAIDAFNYLASFTELDTQVPVLADKVREITDQYGQVTLLGHSQGGLLGRAVIEYGNNPNIHTFISLSAPTNGQYGVPYAPTEYTPNTIRETYRFCYTAFGQLFSFCQFWNDPLQQERYLSSKIFLSRYNNLVPHDHTGEYKKNFSNLHRLVLTAGSGDIVIIPWQSAQFGSYDTEMNIVPMKQQEFYIKDTFGLRTLDERGSITFCNNNDVTHIGWLSSETVYQECIRPWIVA